MGTNDYIQFGCGLCAPSTWQNFDASPTLRLQKLPLIGRGLAKAGVGPQWPHNVKHGDIIKGLPISPDSCRAIYCSHVLEHLSLSDFRTALQNTHTYLNKDGIFRLVVPDLERMIKSYNSTKESEAAIQFIKNTCMGLKNRRSGIQAALHAMWANSGHRWLWDYKAMKKELESTGFTNVRRAYYGDSADPKFTEVEDKHRWNNELGVECTK